MTVANVSVNKISTIPRQCHPAEIIQKVMDGLHCPLGDVTLSERGQRPRLLVYIIQLFVCLLFVCLFVRDSGKTYCTGCHQTARDYKVGLQKCSPRVEIARLAVFEEHSYISAFSFAADGHFISYHSLTSGYQAV